MGNLILAVFGIVLMAGGAGNSDLNPTDNGAGVVPALIGLVLFIIAVRNLLRDEK